MRLHIALLIPGMEIYPGILDSKSLGGSETAGLCMAGELGKLGHKIFMFCNTPKTVDDGNVRFVNQELFSSFATRVPHDVCIIQRAPRAACSRFESKLNVLWMHDLALGRSRDEFSACLWNVDMVAVLSEFMLTQYQEVYAPPPGALWVTRNGIDLSLFPKPGGKRDRRKLMYCSRPERGLDRLLGILPKLLERDPGIRLYIAGYDNQVQEMAEFYAKCQALAAPFGDRVKQLGALTKRDLYKHYASAGVYVYPTPSAHMPSFREINCITMMECMASGLPVVATDSGAIGETLYSGAGTLIPDGPEHDDRFVDATLKYIEDADVFRFASAAGYEHAQQLSWTSLAEEWLCEFERRIRRMNADKNRLAYHFLRRSDIVAAKALEHCEPVQARIAKDWAFMDDDASFRAHYEKIGRTHTDSWEGAQKEPRLAVAIDWFRGKPEIRSILDVGCAQGNYAIGISNAIGDRLRIDGIDCDPESIRWAREYREKHSSHRNNLSFELDTELVSPLKYDCLFLCEVLEHVPDPVALMGKYEGYVKPGGWVYITVPFGAWEEMSYRTYPHRCHLWEYDHHDIDDLFGKKKDLNVSYLAGGQSSINAEPLGWHVITYRTGATTGAIDMQRKLWLQRPRQTVSASIIAGPGVEQTLEWLLTSIRDVADEIVIANTGMSGHGMAIAERYTSKIVTAGDPLEVGFDTPRNTALDNCVMDWVLWIDTDEKLLGAAGLGKYLRDNIWNGYGIRQHHFSIDMKFEPDMPVRLFRRLPGPQSEGREMRHVGRCHEHPELGLNNGPGPVIVLVDVNIAHVGYLTEDIRQKRYWRNLPLLQMDIRSYPERKIQKHFICRDNILLARYTISVSRQVTDRVRDLCEETIALYREHFMGKPGLVAIDTLQYYSEALKILGRGFDVQFDIKAEAPGSGKMNGQGTRFETLDDVMSEVKWRSEDVVKPLSQRYW